MKRPTFEDPDVTERLHQGPSEVPKVPKVSRFEVDGCPISFRTKKPEITGKREIRNYFVGSFPLCFVEVWEEGHHPAGKWVAFPAGRGNGGIGFGTEKDLHAFFAQELAKLPGP